jgi:osmoprotectant transport system permease protein
LIGFDLLSQMARYGAAHKDAFLNALSVHAAMSLLSLSVAAALAIPAGFFCTRIRWLKWLAPNVFNAIRVVPGLAILALLIPVLGTGWIPASLALVLLAFPPILLNTATGFNRIDADALEAARGMGMSPGEMFHYVEFPLALPTILNGLRVAAVEVISGATLTAFIGGGGLGTFIVNGLSLYELPLLLLGALPVAGMAILAEVCLGWLTRQTVRYQTC